MYFTDVSETYQVKLLFYINSFSIISNIAPGKPKRPTNNDVPTLMPIWNPHTDPTRFITNISNAPKTEFIISLTIAFSGTANILPIIHKTIIHPKIIKTLEKSNFYHHTFNNTYDKNWTIITYPTWFFLKYISSIIFRDNPLSLAFKTKKSNLLLLALIWYV